MKGTIKPIPLKESEAREVQLLWGVMEILSETSPRLKKRRKFLLNLRGQELRVVCKGMPDTTPGYTVIEQDVLHTYIRQAIGHRCVLCDGAGCDMARCELRKALKKTVMFEIDEAGGICLGKKLLTHMEE